MSSSLPTIALSIRQPWAWLIVNGYKDIENRSWLTKFRGRIFVHASKGLTKEELLEARRVVYRIAPEIFIPPFDALERGGIVGAVDIVGCVRPAVGSSLGGDSKWLFGPYGFQLENPEVLPFRNYKGALGFFKVKEGAAEAEGYDERRQMLFVFHRHELAWNVGAGLEGMLKLKILEYVGHIRFKVLESYEIREERHALGVVVWCADFPICVAGATLPRADWKKEKKEGAA